MAHISSGKRYAQAVFELALETGDLEGWRDGLIQLTAIATDQEVMSVLENPKRALDSKKHLLQKRLGAVNPLVLNLACLLMSRGILKIAGAVSRQYGRLLNAHHGIEHADVITAVPLNDEDRERLSRQFTEIAGHNVIINARIDPSIVGGFTARIGDTLIDGSIHNMLESLKKNIAWAGR